MSERCEFQFKPSGNRCQKEAGHTGSHIHTVAAEEALMPSPTAQPPQELVLLAHKVADAVSKETFQREAWLEERDRLYWRIKNAIEAALTRGVVGG